MSQADPGHITDTTSSRSDENTAAASGEANQTSTKYRGEKSAYTNGATESGWCQLNGVPEIREMIFQECLSDLHDAILEEQSSGPGPITVDSFYLLSCLNMLHVCKDFLNEVIPLLRKSLALVTTWKFCDDHISWDKPWSFRSHVTWEDVRLHIAGLKRLVALSAHHGLRFERYTLESQLDDPGGFETGRFLVALAKHMRVKGVTGDHDCVGLYKSWWRHRRGFERDPHSRRNPFSWRHFDYLRPISDDNPVHFAMDFHSDGRVSDYVVMRLESDAATLDFQDFDWTPTEEIGYEDWRAL